MEHAEPAFYFSLPRLVNRWRGGSDCRTEMNGLETNVVGATVHGIAYLFAAHVFLDDLPAWERVVFLFPLVLLVWIWWLVILYANSLVLKLLRACGLLRDLPDNRAQSVLIGIMITAFACEFVRSGSWLGLIGWLWIAVVFLNLAAAVVLALIDRNGTAPA